MSMERVEKHVLKKADPYFKLIKGFCHDSKNLYNHANYIIRQEFISNGKKLKYGDVYDLVKDDTKYPDYKNMPTAQSAQQTLMKLDQNWNSFLGSKAEYQKNLGKFTGKPKMPKYLKKDGHYQLVMTNQNCKLEDGVIRFPKVFQGFTLKTKCQDIPGFTSFQQVRIFPEHDRLKLEVVYKVKETEEQPDNGRYVGIDLGVDNLAAVVNNFHAPAFVLNGKPLKSMNQYYNKKKAHYQSLLPEGTFYSHKLERLDRKRNHKIEDYMHQASRYLVTWCVGHNVSRIVIGKNDGWKSKKKGMQNFTYIPYQQFIKMLTYKASEYGITVIETEESYTSGTSFLDGELPVKECYDKRRRISRGMFRSNEGILINADINAAYQILNKVISVKWDRGCVLHPVIVTVPVTGLTMRKRNKQIC